MSRDLPKTLTPTQRRALHEFRRLYREIGGPPSVTDLAGALGIARTVAYRHLLYLTRKGALKRQPPPGRGFLPAK